MPGKSDNLEKYIEDLENRIDPALEDELMREWIGFTAGHFKGDIFSPQRKRKSPPQVAWPETTVNGAIADFDQMALRQLGICSKNIESGDGALMAVRSSYGTVIIPSLFGVELFFMEESQNTLPASKPLAGGKEAFRKIIKKGLPDLDSGLGGKVFEMGRRYMDIFSKYPKIGKYVHLYHPDYQGPLDICEMLWGSDLFLDLVDEPALVKDFLAHITETYVTLMNRWMEIVPFEKEYNVHWNMLHKGSIMLRIDSGMNISPEMYSEFSVPYDQRLLDLFGGGGIHFCGRGDHYIDRLAAMRGVFAVPMSQPHLNDMEKIFRHTVDIGIKLLGFSRKAADKALASGRSLRGNVHCWDI
jgi:hypothetical protein